MELTFFEKAMVGAATLGNLNGTDPDTISDTIFAIISGKVDEDLRAFFALKQFGFAEAPAKQDSDEVSQMLSKIKLFCQTVINQAIQSEGKTSRVNPEQAKAAKEAYAKMYQPSSVGTVAEISSKYGLSKSQIRKMRADGTLETFLNSNFD